jgi:hypothetical protein
VSDLTGFEIWVAPGLEINQPFEIAETLIHPFSHHCFFGGSSVAELAAVHGIANLEPSSSQATSIRVLAPLEDYKDPPRALVYAWEALAYVMLSADGSVDALSLLPERWVYFQETVGFLRVVEQGLGYQWTFPSSRPPTRFLQPMPSDLRLLRAVGAAIAESASASRDRKRDSMLWQLPHALMWFNRAHLHSLLSVHGADLAFFATALESLTPDARGSGVAASLRTLVTTLLGHHPELVEWVGSFYKARCAVVHGDPDSGSYGALPDRPRLRHGDVARLVFTEIILRLLELRGHMAPREQSERDGAVKAILGLLSRQ